MITRAKSTLFALTLLAAYFSFGGSRGAHAEVTLMKNDAWQLFVNGRVGAFQSYVYGQAYPVATIDPTDPMAGYTPQGGGVPLSSAFAERQPPLPSGQLSPGHIEGSRVRSGLVPNIFGVGVRRELANGTTATAYLAVWAFIESPNRTSFNGSPSWKFLRVPADVREGYIKLQGGWGSLLLGRAATLFSRGAMEIDVMYGHGFGVGHPGNINQYGPAFGHIGFGLVGNGFASGIVYATPKLLGLQLSVGYYDPTALTGSEWERTSWGRPESELTWDIPLGDIGRIHLFGNGAWQKVYAPDSEESTTMYGAGYGGRVEVGPLRLGLAGHWGKGLGLYYAFDTNGPEEAAWGADNRTLRTFTGYYAQSQLVLGKFDLAAGIGITRVTQLGADIVDTRDNDGDPATDARNDDANPNATDAPPVSNIKRQLGISAGITYHVRDYLALEVDYFRADYAWWVSEKQVVHFVNTGITFLW